MSAIIKAKIPDGESIYDREHTSVAFQKLEVSPIKGMYKYYTPTAVNLAGGIPLNSCFPFESMDIHLSDESAAGSSYSLKKGENLNLTYHNGYGLDSLREWTRDHVRKMHNPPREFDVSMTIGTTDGWDKIVTMISGSCVLFDQYIYGISLTACKKGGKKAVGIQGDELGMRPESIRETVLKLRAQGETVSMLYTVPTGHNPTGVTMPYGRKQEIYKVCQEMDLIIIEDDAYYYLYFPGSETPGLENLPKTFLSMDVDGRVIRFDSVSKFIAPGMRVGWVVAAPDFIAKYVLMQDITTQFPNGVAQSMVYGLFQHWGYEGFNNHVKKLQAYYANQRNVLVNSLKEVFPEGKVKFVVPSGGMFLWLSFPALERLGVPMHVLWEKLALSEVITVPGSGFFVPGVDCYAELDDTDGSSCESKGRADTDASNGNRMHSELAVRCCFAAAPAEKIRSAVQKMGECVRDLSLEYSIKGPIFFPFSM